MKFFSNAHAYSAWTRYNKEGEGREEKNNKGNNKITELQTILQSYNMKHSKFTKNNVDNITREGGKGSLEKYNEHNNHLVKVFLFTFFSSFVLTSSMTYIL
jgi:hypothetical protein